MPLDILLYLHVLRFMLPEEFFIAEKNLPVNMDYYGVTNVYGVTFADDATCILTARHCTGDT